MSIGGWTVEAPVAHFIVYSIGIMTIGLGIGMLIGKWLL